MKAEELRTKSKSELKTELSAKRREFFKLRLQKFSGGLQEMHKLRQVKRDIARILTVFNSEKTKADQTSKA